MIDFANIALRTLMSLAFLAFVVRPLLMSMIRKEPNTLQLEEMTQLAVDTAFKQQFASFYTPRVVYTEPEVIDVEAKTLSTPADLLSAEELAALAQFKEEELVRVKGHEEELARRAEAAAQEALRQAELEAQRAAMESMDEEDAGDDESPDDEGDPDGELLATAIDRLSGSDDPVGLSHVVGGVVQLSIEQRQALLEAPDALARLTLLAAHLDRENLLLAEGIRPWQADPATLSERRN